MLRNDEILEVLGENVSGLVDTAHELEELCNRPLPDQNTILKMVKLLRGFVDEVADHATAIVDCEEEREVRKARRRMTPAQREAFDLNY